MLTTLIIDDEAPARSRLRRLLTAHSDLEIAGEAADGLQALQKIQQLRPCLIFLDVQMPGLNGFQVLESLPADFQPPLVVFTTAFDRYALAAFDVNAVGYLLKPINRDRLASALNRARKLMLSESLASEERDRARRMAASMTPALQHLIGRRRDRFILLRLDQVSLIFVEDGLVKVKTETETFWTDYKMNDLEARLPSPPFFTARRSTIVNMQYVKEIAALPRSTFQLILRDSASSTKVLVSERQSKLLRELLHN
jgi:two-component system, LytTR family, response regulator